MPVQETIPQAIFLAHNTLPLLHMQVAETMLQTMPVAETMLQTIQATLPVQETIQDHTLVQETMPVTILEHMLATLSWELKT